MNDISAFFVFNGPAIIDRFGGNRAEVAELNVI
ncbi:hypothetical protein KCQ_10540 [Pectobacterium atrosepticum ICMP 1526]|nr:hypothetical protein KCQ_10540 [Pectobacterium atrosepticum ICMP 1526]